MDLYTLPEDLRRQVEEELEPGETVRWLGQPQPRGFPWGTLFPMLMGAFWIFFSLIFLADAAGLLGGPQQFPMMGPPGLIVFGVFAVVSILIGVALLCSPMWARRSTRRRAQKSAYVITDRRAIILDAGFAGTKHTSAIETMASGGFPFFLFPFSELSIRTIGPDDMNTIERIQRADGTGDLIIQRGRAAFWSPFPGVRADPPVGFFSIPNVRDIERLLRQLRETADAPSA